MTKTICLRHLLSLGRRSVDVVLAIPQTISHKNPLSRGQRFLLRPQMKRLNLPLFSLFYYGRSPLLYYPRNTHTSHQQSSSAYNVFFSTTLQKPRFIVITCSPFLRHSLIYH